jgi:hypothetical protein
VGVRDSLTEGEGGRESERESVCERERESVCLCERGRERESQGVGAFQGLESLLAREMVLTFCLGKMRICRPKAAQWRRETGIGYFLVSPGPLSAPSDPVNEVSSLCPRLANFSSICRHFTCGFATVFSRVMHCSSSLLYYCLELSDTKSISLNSEPSSEPLHISAK